MQKFARHGRHCQRDGIAIVIGIGEHVSAEESANLSDHKRAGIYIV